MREAEVLARRRELVRASAKLQRARAQVRLERLGSSRSPMLTAAIDLGRRMLTPQLAMTVATLLVRRWFANRAR